MVRLRYIVIVNGVAMGLKWVFRCLLGLIIALSVDLQQGYAQQLVNFRTYVQTVPTSKPLKKLVTIGSSSYLFIEDNTVSHSIGSSAYPEIIVLKIDGDLDTVRTFRTGLFGFLTDAIASRNKQLIFVAQSVNGTTRRLAQQESVGCIDTNGNYIFYHESLDSTGFFYPQSIVEIKTGDLVVSGTRSINGGGAPTTYIALFSPFIGPLWRNNYLTQFTRPTVKKSYMNRNQEIVTFFTNLNTLMYLNVDLQGNYLSNNVVYTFPFQGICYSFDSYLLSDSTLALSAILSRGANRYRTAYLRTDKNLDVVFEDSLNAEFRPFIIEDDSLTLLTNWRFNRAQAYARDTFYLSRQSKRNHRVENVYGLSINRNLFVAGSVGMTKYNSFNDLHIAGDYFFTGFGYSMAKIRGFGKPPEPPTLTSIVKIQISNRLTAYPNPIISTVKLTGLPPDRVYDYVVTSVTGQEVAAGRYNPDEALDLSGLASGVYMLRLSAGHAVSYVRLVKE